MGYGWGWIQQVNRPRNIEYRLRMLGCRLRDTSGDCYC